MAAAAAAVVMLDAVVEAVSSQRCGIFAAEEQHEKGTESFSLWLFQFWLALPRVPLNCFKLHCGYRSVLPSLYLVTCLLWRHIHFIQMSPSRLMHQKLNGRKMNGHHLFFSLSFNNSNMFHFSFFLSAEWIRPLRWWLTTVSWHAANVTQKLLIWLVRWNVIVSPSRLPRFVPCCHWISLIRAINPDRWETFHLAGPGYLISSRPHNLEHRK